MTNSSSRDRIHSPARLGRLAAVVILVAVCISVRGAKEETAPPPIPLPDAEAKTPAEMKPYTETISANGIKFDMVPIRGGKFLMGSPAAEADRNADEGPQHEVEVDSFWMGKCEVTWGEYELWSVDFDAKLRDNLHHPATERDKLADAIARPTGRYHLAGNTLDKNERIPAGGMSQKAAKAYCHWLSVKTGRYYRLPTEAEWEYACRAGTKSAFSFGDDPEKLGEYGWTHENSTDNPHKVGLKKPNPWGLYDIHGNMAEWTVDAYTPDGYAAWKASEAIKNPHLIPKSLYPVAARGGSWMGDAVEARSASRAGSNPDWIQQDPQLPRSVWWLTDAEFVGFRVVRPLVTPSPQEQAKLWDAGVDHEGAD